MRSDLPTGFLAAQLVHAAGESAPGGLPPETNAVVLAVPGEPELLALSARLAQLGVPHHLVREPDPPYHGAATAIGLPPQPREPVRRLLSSLPLLRDRSSEQSAGAAPSDVGDGGSRPPGPTMPG